MRWGAGMAFCTSDADASGLETLLCRIGKVLKTLRHRQPNSGVARHRVVWTRTEAPGADVAVAGHPMPSRGRGPRRSLSQ
jgi:hypothetical protein